MISFILCFGFSFSSYASNLVNDSSIIQDYYSIDSSMPYLQNTTVVSMYSSSGGVSSNVLWPSGYNLFTTNIGSYWDNNKFSSFLSFPLALSITEDTTNITYNLSSYDFMAFPNYNSNGMYYFYFYSDSDCVFMDGSVYSESPINYALFYVSWGTLNYLALSGGTASCYGSVNEASSNGFYVCPVLSRLSYRWYPVFCTMPIYQPSSDGFSGFTSIDNFDFSSMDDYYNFNYQITGNYFVDPNAPEPVLPSQDKYNLKFKVTSFYAADDYEKFYENFRFNWNTYTLDHPESYYFCSNYNVVYQDDTMNQPVTFYYGSNDYPGQIFSDNLVSMAYRGKNNGVIPTTWSWGLNLSGFRDQNGKSLDRYISETINRVTGTHVDFAEPSTIFTAINGDLTDVLNWITATPIYSVIPLYESYIVKFVVTGEHWLSTGSPDWDGDNISEVESNHYISSYNFLSGNTDIISTDNVNEPYESEDSSFVPSSIASGGSGGGASNIYNAPNATATATGGNVTVNMGNSDPYHIEQVDYDNIGEVFDTVKRDMSRESGNGFFQVIAHVFAFIPSQIWQVLLTGITVITAVSVIRFVRNK